jgi:hypothetical protein
MHIFSPANKLWMMKMLLQRPLVKIINHLDFFKIQIVKNVFISFYFLECLGNLQFWKKIWYQDIAQWELMH